MVANTPFHLKETTSLVNAARELTGGIDLVPVTTHGELESMALMVTSVVAGRRLPNVIPRASAMLPAAPPVKKAAALVGSTTAATEVM